MHHDDRRRGPPPPPAVRLMLAPLTVEPPLSQALERDASPRRGRTAAKGGAADSTDLTGLLQPAPVAPPLLRLPSRPGPEAVPEDKEAEAIGGSPRDLGVACQASAAAPVLAETPPPPAAPAARAESQPSSEDEDADRPVQQSPLGESSRQQRTSEAYSRCLCVSRANAVRPTVLSACAAKMCNRRRRRMHWRQ